MVRFSALLTDRYNKRNAFIQRWDNATEDEAQLALEALGGPSG
jgi:hypothetical protein